MWERRDAYKQARPVAKQHAPIWLLTHPGAKPQPAKPQWAREVKKASTFNVWREQEKRLALEGQRDPGYGLQRDIDLAVLDLSNPLLFHANRRGDLLLRQSFFDSGLPAVFPKRRT
jgi:hypothetical protein